MILPSEITDGVAAASLLLIVLVFTVGAGPRIERLWRLKRQEMMLILALPILYRASSALHLADVADLVQRVQAFVLLIAAARTIWSLRAFARPGAGP